MILQSLVELFKALEKDGKLLDPDGLMQKWAPNWISLWTGNC